MKYYDKGQIWLYETKTRSIGNSQLNGTSKRSIKTERARQIYRSYILNFVLLMYAIVCMNIILDQLKIHKQFIRISIVTFDSIAQPQMSCSEIYQKPDNISQK
ncbi:hypothetical protein pb186bvf_017493 [Paramecium bursaria]